MDDISTYCKAFKDMKLVDESMRDEISSLYERIRTAKTMLTETMILNKMTCIEVMGDDGLPMYFRLKQQIGDVPISMDTITHGIKKLRHDVTNVERQDSVSKTITEYVKEFAKSSTEGREDKFKFFVSENRQRNHEGGQVFSDELMDIARDYLNAQRELKRLRGHMKEQKEPFVKMQQMVEESVKQVLRNKSNMTQRVNITQGNDQWMYYLRCTEKECNVPFNQRKVLTCVEQVISSVIDSFGLDKSHNIRTLPDEFWTHLSVEMNDKLAFAKKERRCVSRLTLNKSAPRKR